MKKLLWLDDYRKPDDYIKGDYIISCVKNYEEFCSFINENGLPDVVCFDHDLGEEKSGYDCAKFLVEYCMDNMIDFPNYYVQSQNPVGRENIISYIENFKRCRAEAK